MSKIIFVNRYYRPDHSATAQLLTDLAEYLVREGFAVTIVTSRQLYLDPKASLPAKETLGGVDIHRIPATRFGRGFLPGRLIDYLSFYISVLFHLLRIVHRGDSLVVKTDPPLLSVVGAVVARVKGATLINWLQDIFPEVADELGVRLHPRIYQLIRTLRNYTLRTAHANVVLGNAMAAHLDRCEVAAQQVRIIPNWVLDTGIEPVDHERNALRSEWNLQGKFVVAYSGNLGRAHDYRTILGAATALRDDDNFVFLFVGNGAGLTELQAEANAADLDNLMFKPYQPIERLGLSLGVADIHWASLVPQLEGLIVPSKTYGVLAAARPLLFVGAADGEVGQLVTRNNCGQVFAPGNVDGVIQCLRALRDDRIRLRQLGDNARALYQREFAYGVALRKWRAVLHEVAAEQTA
jgi:glycosyltransferase involved in cell wall biosynthesis